MDDTGLDIERHVSMGPRDAWAQKKANSLYGILFFAALGTGVFAYLAGLVAPDWRVEFGFVGFIVGAIVFGLLASRRAKARVSDEYATGFARTEEEVRQALADIEARKK